MKLLIIASLVFLICFMVGWLAVGGIGLLITGTAFFVIELIKDNRAQKKRQAFIESIINKQH